MTSSTERMALADRLDLAEMVETRIGQNFDGECHLVEAEARLIARLLREPVAGPDPLLKEAVGLLREAVPELETYPDEPDDVERAAWLSNGLKRRTASFLSRIEADRKD